MLFRSADEHEPRDDVERIAVLARLLTQCGNQHRPEDTGKAPRGQHETVDRPDAPGAESILSAVRAELTRHGVRIMPMG